MQQFKKMSAAIATGVLCLSILTGCGANEKKDSAQTQLDEAAGQTAVEDADMEPSDDPAAGEENRAAGSSLGEFSGQDVNGAAYTNEIFQDYDLTMVNIFTTWCTPCINEIPDLEKLHQEMADQGVNIVGVVMDAIDMDGNMDEDAVEKAKVLAERTGASYPFLIPDAEGWNGRLNGIQAVPETFFVDKNGTIVGSVYTGDHSLESWREVVEAERGSLKGDAS